MKKGTLGTTGIPVPRAFLGCGTSGGIGGARHLVGRGLDPVEPGGVDSPTHCPGPSAEPGPSRVHLGFGAVRYRATSTDVADRPEAVLFREP